MTKKNWLGILVMLTAFALVAAGCEQITKVMGDLGFGSEEDEIFIPGGDIEEKGGGENPGGGNPGGSDNPSGGNNPGGGDKPDSPTEVPLKFARAMEVFDMTLVKTYCTAFIGEICESMWGSPENSYLPEFLDAIYNGTKIESIDGDTARVEVYVREKILRMDYIFV
jgi:hypothetical protein